MTLRGNTERFNSIHRKTPMLESPSISEHCEIFIARVLKNICFKNENGCLLRVLLKPSTTDPPTR